MGELISLTINGRTVRAPAGTTILQTARGAGVEVPTLCYHPNLTANGICRLCVVEVVGARNLQPACVVPVVPGMVVNTETDRVLTARRVILELLASTVDLSEAPEVVAYMDRIGAKPERFAGGVRREFPVAVDNPFYIRDYSKCIMCWRCIQVCADDVPEHVRTHLGGQGHRQPRGDRLQRADAGHHVRFLRQLRWRLSDRRAQGSTRVGGAGRWGLIQSSGRRVRTAAWGAKSTSTCGMGASSGQTRRSMSRRTTGGSV
jgi:ferredoxin